MRKFIAIFIATALFIASHAIGIAQSISIMDISPASPASLSFNQRITIIFEYKIPDANGARIFIRPVTSGRLTLNYVASSSPIFRGSGQETVNFTIRSGNVTVDQLRVQVLSASKNELFFEFYVPVEFTFTSSKYTLVDPNILHRKPRKVIQQFDDKAPVDTSTTERTIVKRMVKEDGAIETHYSDGTIWGSMPFSDLQYSIDPETGDTTFIAMRTGVQGASQPASPPGSMATTYSEVDNEWLMSLNAWLEYLASQQLNKIGLLLEDENSFQNYKNFEQKNSSTLYEKVNLRYTFLEKLYMNNFQ